MRREQGLRLQTEARVDWFAMLDALNRRGIPTATVAALTTIPKSTILGWKQGAEPKHADGERLVQLWMQVTDLCREHVPMTRCPLFLER